MTNYTPPIHTGLRGDDRVEDQLRQFVDDLADARKPGVYALRLSKPEDMHQSWHDAHDAMHPDIDAMQSAKRLYYVGAAKDVLERVENHAEGFQVSAVEEVAPPHSVARMWMYDNTDDAFLRESGHALALGAKTGNYVVQN